MKIHSVIGVQKLLSTLTFLRCFYLVLRERGIDSLPYGEEAYSFDTATSMTKSTIFATHEKDVESGLYYARNRMYDSASGRFTSVDPIKDGLNWFLYCDADPVNRVDPTGLVDKQVKDPAVERYERYGRTKDKDEKLKEQDRQNDYYEKRDKLSPLEKAEGDARIAQREAEMTARSRGATDEEAKKAGQDAFVDAKSHNVAWEALQARLKEDPNLTEEEKFKIYDDARVFQIEIERIKTTNFATTTKGKQIVKRLEKLNIAGRIVFEATNKYAGKYDPLTDTIFVSTLVPDYDIVGTLIHEGTHAVQHDNGRYAYFRKLGELIISGYSLDEEKEAFQNEYEVDSELYPSHAEMPSDSELEGLYPYLDWETHSNNTPNKIGGRSRELSLAF